MSTDETIVSTNNPLFKHISKLVSQARYRRRHRQIVLDGVHLMDSLLQSGGVLEQVIVNPGSPQQSEIAALLQRLPEAVAVTRFSRSLFQQVTELKSPTGIMAVATMPPQAQARPDVGSALLLEDIQDPGNLGTMLRSAAAAGCEAVYLSKCCVDVWSPRVLRAGMGAHFVLPLFTDADLSQIAVGFSGSVIGTALGSNHCLYDLDLTQSVAFIFGNEGAGLSEKLQQQATECVSIPMQPGVESLNVAAACSVSLFEMQRQRRACARM